MECRFTINRVQTNRISSEIRKGLLWLITGGKEEGEEEANASVSVMPSGDPSIGSAVYTDAERTYLAGYSIAPDPDGAAGMALLSLDGLVRLADTGSKQGVFPELSEQVFYGQRLAQSCS